MNKILTLLLLTLSMGLMAQDSWTEQRVSLEEQFMEANTHTLLGKYDKALKILKEIYKEDRDNAGLNFELAKVYGSMNDLAAAVKHAKKAVSLKPNNEYYHLLLGNLQMDNGQNSEAIDAFTTLTNLQPEVTEYYDMLAKAHLSTGDYKSAIATFDRLEMQLGFSEDLALRKVDILTENNKNDEAAKVLAQLVTTYPKEMRYRYNLGSFYRRMGRDQDAIKVYKDILVIDPSDATANLALLDDPDKPSDDTNYLSALQPLIEDEKIPMDKKVLEMVPYLERLPNEPKLAEPLLRIGKTMVQLYPQEAKVKALYADMLNGTGQIEKAIEQYEKTLQINDKVYTVWEQLIYCYEQAGKYEKMLSKSEEAMDFFPNKASAYYLYASAQNHLGEYDQALSYLNDAFMISGKDMYHKAKVENQRARAYMGKEDMEQAKKHLNNSSEWSMGQDAEAVKLFGDWYKAQGNTSEAQKFYDKAEKLDPSIMTKEEKFMRGIK